MKIKEFEYSGKKRIVAVMEESTSNIKGFDLAYLNKEEIEDAKKLCESLNINEELKRLEDEDFNKVKHLMSHFRNFSKAKIGVSK